MLPAQSKSVTRITNKITQQAMCRDGSQWYNGPVVFKTEVLPNGVVILIATNTTPEMRWFETELLILLRIGVRGGVKILSCEGMTSRCALT